MNFAVIGINHKTAPIEIREKVAFTDSKKIEGINILLDKSIDEVVILSTCNRSEIYIVNYSEQIEANINNVIEFYSDFFYLKEIKKNIYFKKDKDAVMHLYKVTSGLDSIVLGEDQILGQVKTAHHFSMDIGGSKKILNKLFNEAVKTAKSIKSTLKISEHPLSISYIGVKFLKDKLNRLSDKNALIIGLGKIGILTLEYLIEENTNKIYMINRNHKKVVDLVKEYPSVIPVDYHNRYEILKNVDILVTATSSPHTIIEHNKLKNINNKLTILDLALPKDVDKKVTKLENITLFDIDDLKNISIQNENKRKELSKKAELIISEQIAEFYVWLKNIKVDPIIKFFNEKCEIIKEDTLDYIIRKVDLDNRDTKIISKMITSSLKRIMRDPILKLKKIDDEDKRETYIKVLQELFDFKIID